MQLVCGNAGNVARSFEARLHNDLSGLRVTYSLTLSSWISVSISGSEEQVAAQLLVKQYGELRDARPRDIVRAWLAGINDDSIALDTGCKRVVVPSVRLAPLGRGTVEQIASRFGLIHCLPMQIRLVGEFDAEFTKNQIETLLRWRKGTDRINVNNATRAQIRTALKRSRHSRDVYAIERLGILEHSIICKKGTDAPGLVPQIGPYLESELACVRGALNVH
jgi:hypothetical protein